MTNTFTLSSTKSWYLDLTGQFMTDAKVGNLTQKGSGNISLTLKKIALNNHLVFTLGCNNILPTSDQRVHSSGEGFSKELISPNIWMRSVTFGIRYNFQSGKMFRARSVESGAYDEKSRMGGGK